jgi:hypothetical protein
VSPGSSTAGDPGAYEVCPDVSVLFAGEDNFISFDVDADEDPSDEDDEVGQFARLPSAASAPRASITIT